MKEIISKEESRKLIKDTVNEIAETVCYTYGPNGKTVILTDNEGNGIVTKDGVSVCNAINFEDPYKNIIANIIKQVGQKTVEEAGDGTTTSICLANAFINKGFELIDQGISYNEIKTSLEELEKYTVKELKANSRKVKKKDIINIAKIASNNDIEIASIINKAYKHSKIVKVEESNLKKDELVEVNGMSLRTTYFDAAFINDGKTNTIKYNDCRIALIDGNMETTDSISKLVYKIDGKPLIVIADHFSDRVIALLRKNYNEGSLKIALVKSPGVNQHRKNIMSDIALYTGSQLLNPNKVYTETEYLGYIDNIEVKKEETILLNSKDNKEVKNLIEELNELVKTDIPKYDKELATQRLQSLTGTVSLIKVGGESPVEIKERFDRIEDAVLAVKSAYEEGMVEGGGLGLFKTQFKSYFTKTPILELSNSLQEPYRILNPITIIDMGKEKIISFDLNPDFYKKGIIDPTKVVRCALQNAISVAKTILGTEAIVLNKYLWKSE
jgi:chaperonin GroEL